MRDFALLEMGCARAMNLATYSAAVLARTAAAYASGFTQALAFVDGNKRTAFVAALAFLRLNGYAFRFDPFTEVRMMEGLATGAVGEDALSDWLREGWAAI